MTDKPEVASGIPGLKIIGAGFGRTGTLSLKAALEELGFGPCYHMVEVFNHPQDTAQWEAASRGESIDWHQLLDGYQATVDWPGCAFYEELLQAYPDARVLLTVRDPASWYESVDSTIYQMRRMTTHFSPAAVLFRVMGLFAPDRRRVGRMINTIVWQGTFNDNFEDKDDAIAIFNQHIENVKKRVSPDNCSSTTSNKAGSHYAPFLASRCLPTNPSHTSTNAPTLWATGSDNARKRTSSVPYS